MNGKEASKGWSGGRAATLVRRAGIGFTFERLEDRTLMSGSPFGPTLSASSLAPIAMQPDSAGTFNGASDNGHSMMRLTDFRADPRFAAFQGQGLSSVVIDTGIAADHPFFGADLDMNGVADRIIYQYDFANDLPIASDLDGHGSNVAAALASGDPSAPGVASEAGLIALRVFNNQGTASFAHVESALRWVVDNAATYNIASVNMSIGDGQNYAQHYALPMLADELSALAQMGVIVVAAAGNSFFQFSGTPGIAYPAADPNVISVGAVYTGGGGSYTYAGGAQGTNNAGAMAPFSQRTDWMDIVAPGAPIIGAAPGGGTVTMHGTSQAAPMIAGIAVLVQQMAVQMLGQRLDLGAFRQLITSTATIIYDSATIDDGAIEQDNVANTEGSYRLVNMLAIANAIYDMAFIELPAPMPNVAPTVAGASVLVPGAIDARGSMLRYDTIARLSGAADGNGDQVLFRVDSIESGRLTVNGRTAQAGTLIGPGDTLVWRAAAGETGSLAAFTLTPTDGFANGGQSVSFSYTVVQSDLVIASPEWYVGGPEGDGDDDGGHGGSVPDSGVIVANAPAALSLSPMNQAQAAAATPAIASMKFLSVPPMNASSVNGFGSLPSSSDLLLGAATADELMV